MTRMIPLTNEQLSINMKYAPDSNGFPASNRQGLRSLGSTISAVKSLVTILALALLVVNQAEANQIKQSQANLWKITAYCACVKCCGKGDAITASGKKAKPNHTIALNWLPFGTRVLVDGVPYVVEDRGAESHFGTYYHRKGAKKQVKHIDIYMSSHLAARSFGVKYLPVEVIHGR